MTIKTDSIWESLNENEWRGFARDWLAEHGGPPYSGEQTWPSKLFGGTFPINSVGEALVAMNFTASPESQWTFIEIALEEAASEDELGHLAAGPLEHLLANHGEIFVERIENSAAEDRKLALALTGVYRNKMTLDVWTRIQSIQKDCASKQESDH